MTRTTYLALRLPSKRAISGIAWLPDPRPGTRESALTVRARAVNPFKRCGQAVGDVVTAHFAHPAVLGSDVAGELVSAGQKAIRTRVARKTRGGGVQYILQAMAEQRREVSARKLVVTL